MDTHISSLSLDDCLACPLVPPPPPIPTPSPVPTPPPVPSPTHVQPHLPSPTLPPPPQHQAEINFALALNFSTRPRIHRLGDSTIVVHKSKQALELHRIMTIFTANKFGYNDPSLTHSQCKTVQIAACRLVSYDYGYPTPFATTQIPRWQNKIDQTIIRGPSPSSAQTVTPLATSHKGTVSYVDRLNAQHPSYIRNLFRYAQRI